MLHRCQNMYPSQTSQDGRQPRTSAVLIQGGSHAVAPSESVISSPSDSISSHSSGLSGWPVAPLGRPPGPRGAPLGWTPESVNTQAYMCVSELPVCVNQPDARWRRSAQNFLVCVMRLLWPVCYHTCGCWKAGLEAVCLI
jgi:hypothetical protein